jgi:hypothetical protein
MGKLGNANFMRAAAGFLSWGGETLMSAIQNTAR